MTRGKRKLAAHRIVIEGVTLNMGVVEIDGGRVTNVRTLVGEEPGTEWLPGEIRLIKEPNGTSNLFHNGIPIT